MNAYERFACGFFLCEYPDNTTFDDVLDYVISEDDAVIIWQAFEDTPPRELVEMFRDMVLSLSLSFTPKQVTP